jgi:hypothetical protein
VISFHTSFVSDKLGNWITGLIAWNDVQNILFTPCDIALIHHIAVFTAPDINDVILL